MTLACRGLTAQKHGPLCERIGAIPTLNPSISHKLKEELLVLLPRHLFGPIRSEHICCWREVEVVGVLRVYDPFQEEFQVAALREARKLRHIVETNVEQSLDFGRL
jgi:hypothetical protein